MLPQSLQFIQGLFANIWRLLTGFYIPGTDLTPAALIVGIFIINLFIRYIKGLLEIGGSNDRSDKKSSKESE